MGCSCFPTFGRICYTTCVKHRRISLLHQASTCMFLVLLPIKNQRRILSKRTQTPHIREILPASPQQERHQLGFQRHSLIIFWCLKMWSLPISRTADRQRSNPTQESQNWYAG